MARDEAARERTPEEWASFLKSNWETRARSDARDFYIASHPGWSQREVWEAQAERDAQLMLWGLEEAACRDWEVLEIGCGVGRLARPFAARVRGYTGFDIAPGMVAEARRRNADLARTRFFVSSGLGVPDEAADRTYDLALALAVFIHCPRAVTAALVESACALLRPGGQLRFQLLADPNDPTGIASMEAAESAHRDAREQEAIAPDTEVDKALLDGTYYMGDAFRYDQVAPFLERASGGGAVTTIRTDLAHVYGWIEKPAS